jgi:hypothetical protein
MLEPMRAKHIALIGGAVVALSVSFFGGMRIGKSREGARVASGNAAYIIPESVREYQAIESGDTDMAKMICGWRLRDYTGMLERNPIRGDVPHELKQALPEAERIIAEVYSNEYKVLVVSETNQQSRSVWSNAFRSILPGITATNPQGGANGRQPFSSETNRASAAAASRRSP